MDLSSRLVEDETPETRTSLPSDGVSIPEDSSRVVKRRQVRRRRHVVVLVVVLSLLAVPGWSVGHTLAANNTDPLSVRVVEWARDHHLGGLVTKVEDFWYTHHQPPKGGTPKGGIPRADGHHGEATSSSRPQAQSCRRRTAKYRSPHCTTAAA